MTSIEPQQQLEFLSKIQRLLGEGQFTATYKYALLLAIADICVEDGEDSEAPFEIYTRKIAEKFISYYWPQVRPYAGKVLRQNTGNMPAVISALERIAGRGIVGLNELKRDAASWTVLVRDVDRVVREMPLWKLQRSGAFLWNFFMRTEGGAMPSNSGPGSCSVCAVSTNSLLTWCAARGCATFGASTGRCSVNRATSINFSSVPNVRRWTNTFQFSAKCRKHVACIASAKWCQVRHT